MISSTPAVDTLRWVSYGAEYYVGFVLPPSDVPADIDVPADHAFVVFLEANGGSGAVVPLHSLEPYDPKDTVKGSHPEAAIGMQIAAQFMTRGGAEGGGGEVVGHASDGEENGNRAYVPLSEHALADEKKMKKKEKKKEEEKKERKNKEKKKDLTEVEEEDAQSTRDGSLTQSRVEPTSPETTTKKKKEKKKKTSTAHTRAGETPPLSSSSSSSSSSASRLSSDSEVDDDPFPSFQSATAGGADESEGQQERENQWRAVEALAGVAATPSHAGGEEAARRPPPPPRSRFEQPSLEEFSASLSGGSALVVPYIPRIHHAYQQLVQQAQREGGGEGGRRSHGDRFSSTTTTSTARLLNRSVYEVVQAIEAKLQETMRTIRFLRHASREVEAKEEEEQQQPHPHSSTSSPKEDVKQEIEQTISRLMDESTAMETLVPQMVHLVSTPAWRGEPMTTRATRASLEAAESGGGRDLSDPRSVVDEASLALLEYSEASRTFIDPMLLHVYPLSLAMRSGGEGSPHPPPRTSDGLLEASAFLRTTTTTGGGGGGYAALEPNAREKIRHYQSQFQRLQRQERLRHQERHKRALLWKGLQGSSSGAASSALSREREKARRRAEANGGKRRKPEESTESTQWSGSTMMLSEVLSSWNKSKGLLNVDRVADVQLVKPEGYFSTRYSSVRKRREEAAVHRLLAWRQRGGPGAMAPAFLHHPHRSRGEESSRGVGASLSHRSSTSIVSSKDVDAMDHLVRKRMQRHSLHSKKTKMTKNGGAGLEVSRQDVEEEEEEDEAMETASTAGLMAWYREKTNESGRGRQAGGGGGGRVSAAPVLYRFRDQQQGEEGEADVHGGMGGGMGVGPTQALLGMEGATAALLPPLALPDTAPAPAHSVEALFQLHEAELLAQQEAVADKCGSPTSSASSISSVGSVFWMSTSHPGESATDDPREEEEEEVEKTKKPADDPHHHTEQDGAADDGHPSRPSSPPLPQGRAKTWRDGAKAAILEQLTLYVKGRTFRGKPNVLPPEAFKRVASLLLDRATEAASHKTHISLQLESNNRTVPFTKQMGEKLKKSVDTYVYRHYIAPRSLHSEAGMQHRSMSLRSPVAPRPPATSASRSPHRSRSSSVSSG